MGDVVGGHNVFETQLGRISNTLDWMFRVQEFENHFRKRFNEEFAIHFANFGIPTSAMIGLPLSLRIDFVRIADFVASVYFDDRNDDEDNRKCLFKHHTKHCLLNGTEFEFGHGLWSKLYIEHDVVEDVYMECWKTISVNSPNLEWVKFHELCEYLERYMLNTEEEIERIKRDEFPRLQNDVWNAMWGKDRVSQSIVSLEQRNIGNVEDYNNKLN